MQNLPMFPFIDPDGIDDVAIAVANMWIDQYLKTIGMIATVERIKPVQGKKWADGMSNHWLGRLQEMLENCPPGIYFKEIS